MKIAVSFSAIVDVEEDVASDAVDAATEWAENVEDTIESFQSKFCVPPITRASFDIDNVERACDGSMLQTDFEKLIKAKVAGVPEVVLTMVQVDGGKTVVGVIDCPYCGHQHFTSKIECGETTVFCGNRDPDVESGRKPVIVQRIL